MKIKINSSDQKQRRKHNIQPNKETEMGRKAIAWIFETTNRLRKGNGSFRNQSTIGNYPDKSIKIGQNPEKISRDFCCHSDSSERLSVNPSGKNSQLVTIIIIL